MYSFEPSEEQKMLIEAVSRFAENDLRPAAHDAEEEGGFPEKIVSKGWELGILQASVPEQYGGFGDRSAVTSILAGEEMGWGDLAGAMAVMTPNLFVVPILQVGSEEQKQQYIPPVIEAGWMPYTAAMLEFAFDYDPTALKTTAAEDANGYVLNGEKAFVPFAREAKAMIVYASLDGVTQGFIVEQGAVGLTVSEEREKLMSLNALPMYRVKLEDVRVSKSNRLGGEAGHDFAPVLAASYLANASLALGVARAALEYSIVYAKEREVFGVKVAQKQAVAFMLAEMATEIEAMRLMVWEAAWMLDTGNPEAFKQAYLAGVGASDMVVMVTDRAVQVLGGHGYIREHPVEMWMRNGRGFATFTGLAVV